MNAYPISRVCAIGALKCVCYYFNILLDLSHSHDVEGTVAHNLNNVCKFGYMSLSQVFKDCAIVEGVHFGVFFHFSFHRRSSSVALVGIE